MTAKKWAGYFCIALTGALFSNAAVAEDAMCGLSDEAISAALAKTAGSQQDLPRIAKVWKGKLKGRIIRVSFSDKPYSITEEALNTASETVNKLYRDMSRNTFEWDFIIHPTILAAPGTAAEYGANFNSLQSWITSQIKAAGLARGTDYDVYIASFPNISVGWAGLSNMSDADWINGSYSAGVVGHELGHSVSLPHAHSIEAGSDMFGTPGTTSQTNEYGNPFDIMGRGGNTAHFNAMYKWRIGWEDVGEVQEVKTSGLYRLYAHDNATHKDRLLSIRVPTGNAAYAYWFEYRTIATAARTGANVLFQGFRSATNLDDWYLDTTPGSKTSGDESDGVLAVGKEFKDKYGEGSYKVIAVSTGVTGPEAWMDIQVTIPGTSLFPDRHVNLLRPGWDDASAFSLMGRSLKGSQSSQAIILKGAAGRTQQIMLQR